jgi:hypothetical protein
MAKKKLLSCMQLRQFNNNNKLQYVKALPVGAFFNLDQSSTD